MKFATKKEALAHLEANPLSCVTWMEGARELAAIYWNGKRRIVPAQKKFNLNYELK